MIFQLTAAGAAAFLANPSLFQITKVVLGNDFGYTLASPPVNIQGAPVYDSTLTWSKSIAGANTLRFSRLLDDTVGNFQFGEAALYDGSTVVAVGVSPTLITKTKAAGSDDGNSINLMAFITSNNSNSYGFVEVSNSDSNLRIANALHIDALQPPYEGEANAYIVNGLDPDDTPSLAFCDLYGRWNFTDRPRKYFSGTVAGTLSATAVDIEDPHEVQFLTPTAHILEFTSGRLRGYVRRLTTINDESFGWSTPLTILPQLGDTFIIYGPENGGTSLSGQSSIQFKDEGSDLGTPGTVSVINFTGSGITTSRVSNTLTLLVESNVGRHSISVSASEMRPSVVSGCASLALASTVSNRPDLQTLDFDATIQEYAQFSITMPKSWNKGPITFRPIWSHSPTSSNFGVVWSLQAVALSDDDSLESAFGTAEVSIDTGGTANDIYVGPESASLVAAGSASSEDTVFFRVSREVLNGSDTLTVDARLHAIVLYITTDATNDA